MEIVIFLSLEHVFDKTKDPAKTGGINHGIGVNFQTIDAPIAQMKPHIFDPRKDINGVHLILSRSNDVPNPYKNPEPTTTWLLPRNWLI
jgi:hypothetical protein